MRVNHVSGRRTTLSPSITYTMSLALLSVTLMDLLHSTVRSCLMVIWTSPKGSYPVELLTPKPFSKIALFSQTFMMLQSPLQTLDLLKAVNLFRTEGRGFFLYSVGKVRGCSKSSVLSQVKYSNTEHFSSAVNTLARATCKHFQSYNTKISFFLVCII